MGELYNLFRHMIRNMPVGSRPIVLTLELGDYTLMVHNYAGTQDFNPPGCDAVLGARSRKLHIWHHDRLIGIASAQGEDTIGAEHRPKLIALMTEQISTTLPSNKL